MSNLGDNEANGADEAIDRIESAADVAGALIAAIRDDQWTRPTPCSGWDVRALVNHLVGGLRLYAAALNGDAPSGDHDGTDWLGDDPVSAWKSAVADDLAAWRSPGAGDRTVTISLGTLPASMAAMIQQSELVAHGADLAVAIDAEHDLDPRPFTDLLDAMHAMGGIDGFRVPGIFGAERTIAPDAPAHRRLLAYLGRDLDGF